MNLEEKLNQSVLFRLLGGRSSNSVNEARQSVAVHFMAREERHSATPIRWTTKLNEKNKK